ncbi:MAG: hypothetical protein ACPLSY_03590 [Moorellaceae bacterium]
MKLLDPIKDNFWRKRILTDEEMAETLRVAQAIVEENRKTYERQRQLVDTFLAELPAMGYPQHSPEYKYISKRIRPWPKFNNLVQEIKSAQEELKRKAEEERKTQERIAKQEQMRRQKLKELVEKVISLGINLASYLDDEEGLEEAVKDATRKKFEELLKEAPYYVLASFYAHCLRNDWSHGTDSYGYDELCSLQIPQEDPLHPELHALACKLKLMAFQWEGDDGRYFRDVYEELDRLLNDKDKTILQFFIDAHYVLYYL